ncbi:hypothetical protein KCP78_20500 [Salmonella enterica subsp. enterica]|nr:hypothetical protein KCP78_20500 [Salmonella enterica subsp. enterica]
MDSRWWAPLSVTAAQGFYVGVAGRGSARVSTAMGKRRSKRVRIYAEDPRHAR